MLEPKPKDPGEEGVQPKGKPAPAEKGGKGGKGGKGKK